MARHASTHAPSTNTKRDTKHMTENRTSETPERRSATFWFQGKVSFLNKIGLFITLKNSKKLHCFVLYTSLLPIFPFCLIFLIFFVFFVFHFCLCFFSIFSRKIKNMFFIFVFFFIFRDVFACVSFHFRFFLCFCCLRFFHFFQIKGDARHGRSPHRPKFSSL